MPTSEVSAGISEPAPAFGDRTTPLRQLDLARMHDCRVLTSRSFEYRDGGEERVLEILSTTQDLSSTSDELAAQATTWAERYHLDTARANVLRHLAWSPSMSILEIGAGCGAITRFLAEAGALVDALEPAPARAHCARQRTVGLAGVEVFIGDVTDVPPTPAYDVVVIVGVLEYVGAGGAERAPYERFLRLAAGLLKQGGSLVLAIENQLGVKYLCGAPEDHSRRPFDSVEGYPWPGPARTFCQREIKALLRDAELNPTVFGVFPDYKLTRLVYSDRLLDVRPDLVRRIPQFPSPDWEAAEPRVVDEGRAWATLVDSGLGAEASNSFLAIAGRSVDSTPLWPADSLAAYYPPAGWRAAYSLETSIVEQDGTLVFQRRALRDPPDDATVELACESSELVEGADLFECMADADDTQLVGLLEQWLAALDGELGTGARPSLDLLPHNAVLQPDGTVIFVDSKWRAPAVTREVIIRRAALLCGIRLAPRTPPWKWPTLTVEGLVLHIGGLLGLPASGAWLPAAVDYEAAFQAEVTLASTSGTEGVQQLRRGLQEQLSRPLAASRPVALPPDVQSGLLEGELTKAAELIKLERLSASEELAEQVARATDAEIRLAEQAAKTTEAERQLEAVTAELRALYDTRTLRSTKAVRDVYDRMRKMGGRPS